eukprot:gene8110-2769_t
MRRLPLRFAIEIHSQEDDHNEFVIALRKAASLIPTRQCRVLTIMLWRRPLDLYLSYYRFYVAIKTSNWRSGHQTASRCFPKANTTHQRAQARSLAPTFGTQPFRRWIELHSNVQSALLMTNSEQFCAVLAPPREDDVPGGSHPRGRQATARRDLCTSAAWRGAVLKRERLMDLVAPTHRFDDFVVLLCRRLGLPRCPGYERRNGFANVQGASLTARFRRMTSKTAKWLGTSEVPNCRAVAMRLTVEAQAHAMNQSSTALVDLVARMAPVDAEVFERVESGFELALQAARAQPPRSGPGSFDDLRRRFEGEEAVKPSDAPFEWRVLNVVQGQPTSKCAASRLRPISVGWNVTASRGMLTKEASRAVLVRKGKRTCPDLQRLHSTDGAAAVMNSSRWQPPPIAREPQPPHEILTHRPINRRGSGYARLIPPLLLLVVFFLAFCSPARLCPWDRDSRGGPGKRDASTRPMLPARGSSAGRARDSGYDPEDVDAAQQARRRPAFQLRFIKGKAA